MNTSALGNAPALDDERCKRSIVRPVVAPFALASEAEAVRTIATAFDHLRERYGPRVLAHIEQLVAQATPERSSLSAMLSYHMETGGKRLRAMLPLLVAQALGGCPSRMIPFAAACEILHNATLVHDDLQDGDTTRRGSPTVWSKYGAAQAIDLGDAMLYYAMLAVLEIDEPLASRVRVARRLAVDTISVIDGQERELALLRHSATIADYHRMVEGKTSALFMLPMTGAAELCGASTDLVNALGEVARHLGVLFQIQDDVLDLYGDKGRGQLGNDIREGKRSLMVAHACEHAPPHTVRWMLDILDRPRAETTDEDVVAVIDLFHTLGSTKYALAEIERRRELATSLPMVERHPMLQTLVTGIAGLFVGLLPRLVSS